MRPSGDQAGLYRNSGWAASAVTRGVGVADPSFLMYMPRWAHRASPRKRRCHAHRGRKPPHSLSRQGRRGGQVQAIRLLNRLAPGQDAEGEQNQSNAQRRPPRVWRELGIGGGRCILKRHRAQAAMLQPVVKLLSIGPDRTPFLVNDGDERADLRSGASGGLSAHFDPDRRRSVSRNPGGPAARGEETIRFGALLYSRLI